MSHFSILLGVSLLPIIASTFLIKVFYAIIMGPEICDDAGECRDPTVYEYDFMPVNAGFAGACAVGFYQLFYNIYLGKT